MVNVEFGDLPPVTLSDTTSVYDSVAAQLREQPGAWGKVAHVDDKKDLQRWAAAMRTRNIQMKQRLLVEGGWAIWCKAPKGLE
jgi:hypothetical protein